MNKMLDKISHLESTNPKDFWKLVNEIKSGSRIQNESNEISPNVWLKYFKNLNAVNFISSDKCEKSQIVKNYEMWAPKQVKILDTPITIKEIKDLAKKLKCKKATAKDVISNEIIKSSVDSLASYYVKLFNAVFI